MKNPPIELLLYYSPRPSIAFRYEKVGRSKLADFPTPTRSATSFTTRRTSTFLEIAEHGEYKTAGQRRQHATSSRVLFFPPEVSEISAEKLLGTILIFESELLTSNCQPDVLIESTCAEMTMSDYAPINFQVADENGQMLFDLSVPFFLGIEVKQVMECAFVLAQTTAAPDPFLYTVAYYGYSEAAQFPGYLGYEIESICGKPTNNQFYWKLSVNGVATSTGADTTLPGPGSTILWKYTPIPANSDELAARTRVVQSRRASRTVTTT